jgi:hypothetical protein
VTVSAVAFVPSAPLLVPQVAGGSAGLDHAVRAASIDVVARALELSPDEVIVVALTASTGEWSGDARWDFSGFGVTSTASCRPKLPWSLGIGAWLLDECGWSGPRRYIGVTDAEGAMPATVASNAVVVAVGDGSACRTDKAPGALDERAATFDDEVADLMARGDSSGLANLDGVLARELLCSGVAVWRWVAASLGGAAVTTAELATHVAPYGVGYFAALWLVAE